MRYCAESQDLTISTILETDRMEEYKIGRIYRIENMENPLIRYIGSTFQPLHKRFADHKLDFSKWKRDDTKHRCSL
jgi:hypothetical protein